VHQNRSFLRSFSSMLKLSNCAFAEQNSSEEEKKVKSAWAVVKLKGALYAKKFASLTLNAVKTITTQRRK